MPTGFLTRGGRATGGFPWTNNLEGPKSIKKKREESTLLKPKKENGAVKLEKIRQASTIRE